jgi:hypothetical protein
MDYFLILAVAILLIPLIKVRPKFKLDKYSFLYVAIGIISGFLAQNDIQSLLIFFPIVAIHKYNKSKEELVKAQLEFAIGFSVGGIIEGFNISGNKIMLGGKLVKFPAVILIACSVLATIYLIKNSENFKEKDKKIASTNQKQNEPCSICRD